VKAAFPGEVFVTARRQNWKANSATIWTKQCQPQVIAAQLVARASRPQKPMAKMAMPQKFVTAHTSPTGRVKVPSTPLRSGWPIRCRKVLWNLGISSGKTS
jgi:hypothetical protein